MATIKRYLAGAALLAILVFGLAFVSTRFSDTPKPSGPSPEARLLRERILQMPEGVERFLITDINNPGASGLPSQHSLLQYDLEDPVQREKVEGYLREAEAKWGRPSGMPQASPPAPGMVSEPATPTPRRNTEGERYAVIAENQFTSVSQSPLSTFGLDVDTASYSNTRRFLMDGTLPPKDAVRIEELINYFPYVYAPPRGREVVAAHVEVSACPWQPGNLLARIGIKATGGPTEQRPPANLVFLIDVSGSMEAENKLPLVKQALSLLAGQLRADDRIGIVTYAGHSGVALAPVSGDRTEEILGVVEQLRSGGSTNGGAGIALAYTLAEENFIPGGVNRVMLATDGDFNVGVTSDRDLFRMIEEKRDSGVYLSVLGFGTGNLKDGTMEQLADRGNGHYAYIDSMREARKVFGRALAGTLHVVARDAKAQVEFNPARVASYRLIGYENRSLRARDFRDDQVDAGDLGAGDTVTVLYELTPAEGHAMGGGIPLRYQDKTWNDGAPLGEELFFVKLRYKPGESDQSEERSIPVAGEARAFERASADHRFAASVAVFGMILRDSRHRGEATFHHALAWLDEATVREADPERAEFRALVERAAALSGES